MFRILIVSFCLVVWGLEPLHAQHHPSQVLPKLSDQKVAKHPDVGVAIFIPVHGAPLGEDMTVFLKNEGDIFFSEKFFFPKTRIPQALPLLRSKPEILAKFLIAAQTFPIDVEVVVGEETRFIFDLDELVDFAPQEPKHLTLEALPSLVEMDPHIEQALMLYDFEDDTLIADAEVQALPPAKRMYCGSQCEFTFNACMLSAGSSFFQRVLCLFDFRDCANSCIPIPTGPPKGSVDTFHAVGDGRGDNSSDFYAFDFVWLPVVGARIANMVKLGETGHIMLDVAVTPNGTFYAISAHNRLYRLNSANGAASYIGNVPPGINAMDFCGNTLYGWSGTSQNLYTINTSNGSSTNLGSRFRTPSGDIACSTPGLIYGITHDTGNSDHLAIPFRYYNRTVSVDYLGTTTSTRDVYGADFDSSGILYAGKGYSDHIRLYYINPETGEATWIALHFNNYGLNGLAIETLPL